MPSPGTSFSDPRGAGCLPGVLVVSPSECWLSAPRSAGCRPHGVLVVGPRVLVVCPRSSLSCTNGLFRLPDATYPPSRAQKCRFSARNARKWGFRSQKAHKNLDFVLATPENEGPEGKKRTKTPILCSKRPKMRVPEGKSAQKPRFCARKARKRGVRRPKAHKNLDFVLETPENRGPEGKKRTKNPILCSNS